MPGFILLSCSTQVHQPRACLAHNRLGLPPSITKKIRDGLVFILVLWRHFLNCGFLLSNDSSLCPVDVRLSSIRRQHGTKNEHKGQGHRTEHTGTSPPSMAGNGVLTRMLRQCKGAESSNGLGLGQCWLTRVNPWFNIQCLINRSSGAHL